MDKSANYLIARELSESHECGKPNPLKEKLQFITKYRSFRIYQGLSYYATDNFTIYKSDTIEEIKQVIDSAIYVYNVRIGAAKAELMKWDCKTPF